MYLSLTMCVIPLPYALVVQCAFLLHLAEARVGGRGFAPFGYPTTSDSARQPPREARTQPLSHTRYPFTDGWTGARVKEIPITSSLRTGIEPEISWL